MYLITSKHPTFSLERNEETALQILGWNVKNLVEGILEDHVPADSYLDVTGGKAGSATQVSELPELRDVGCQCDVNTINVFTPSQRFYLAQCSHIYSQGHAYICVFNSTFRHTHTQTFQHNPPKYFKITEHSAC